MLIISILIGIAWGWMFYQAVIYREKWCAVMWGIILGIGQSDYFYKSEIIRAFIKGLGL